eukprot:UN19661
MIEISGKDQLIYSGTVNAAATNGNSGTVLFDPHNLTVADQGGPTAPTELADNTFGFTEPLSSTDSIIDADDITNITDTGTAVILQATNDIAINEVILTDEGGGGGNLTLQAGRSILINADITTDNGILSLVANESVANGVDDSQRTGHACGN